jgi:hypothetical protein
MLVVGWREGNHVESACVNRKDDAERAWPDKEEMRCRRLSLRACNRGDWRLVHAVHVVLEII